jgi:hypothetical protein
MAKGALIVGKNPIFTPKNMRRRTFLQTSATLAAGFWLPGAVLKNSDPVIGHGDFRYKIRPDWGKQDPAQYPVNDCHEMAMDRQGRIILVTNETRNNVLVFNKDGKVLDAWGTEFPGAHGLSLHDEGGEEMLYIADYERHEVIKTTLKGKVLQTFGYPADSGKYTSKEAFRPTETAITSNGDVYIADGYGQDWVAHYGPDGKLKNIFGGKNGLPDSLHNAHGIALDARDPASPCLLVTSRVENCVKRFSLDGRHLGTIQLPGAYICRPVILGDNVFFAVLISKLPWDSQSGFVCILDKHNKVVSCPGGNLPEGGSPDAANPMYQTVKVFKHPHDVLPDADGNLYVAQWNAGKVYPARLERTV